MDEREAVAVYMGESDRSQNVSLIKPQATNEQPATSKTPELCEFETFQPHWTDHQNHPRGLTVLKPRNSSSLNRRSLKTNGSAKALASELTDDYGASFLLNVGLHDGMSEDTPCKNLEFKGKCDKLIGDVNQRIDNLSTHLRQLESITEQTLEQECRVED